MVKEINKQYGDCPFEKHKTGSNNARSGMGQRCHVEQTGLKQVRDPSVTCSDI